jgi:hypothetical protein
MAAAVISLLVCFGKYPLARAAIQEPPLEVEIVTAQTAGITGAPLTWRVTLRPQVQQPIRDIALQSGDPRAWVWAEDIPPISVLTRTLVLTVSAVPLIKGDLNPMLELRYNVAGESHTQLVVGYPSLQIEPVETQIEAGVVAGRGAVHKGEDLPVEIWIRNGSPFALAQVLVRGIGADLEWMDLTMPIEIQPGITYSQTLHTIVSGQNPCPRLVVQYTWADATATHSQTLYVSGEPVALETTIIGRIPNELLTAIVGLIVGVLSSFLIGLVGDSLSRTLRKAVDRRHVHGLLRMMVIQAQYAANHGTPVELDPLQTIFQNEGLFTIVEERKLSHYVRDLWEKALYHTNGLNQPGGAQRTKQLFSSAQELEDNLSSLNAGWPIWFIRRIKDHFHRT